MNRKNILLMVFTVVFIASSCSFSKKIESFVVEEKDLNNLSFIEATEDNSVVYTANQESYKLEGEKKLHLGYEIISSFKDKDETMYIAKLDGKQGILDKDFKPIVAFNYDTINILADNLITGEIQGEKYLVDIEKYKMIGPFDNISAFGNGKVIKVDKANESEFIDEKGEEILELRGKNILFSRDGVSVTEKNGLFGLYDSVNNRYIPEENQEIYFSGKNILLKKADRYFYNSDELKIKKFCPTMSDVIIYDLEDGFGLFNLRDGVFYKEIYDEVAPNFDRYLIVGKNNKYNVMDKYREKKLKYPYDYIIKIGRNSFAGGTDKIGLFALIVNDEKVTDEKFENIVEINEDYFIGIMGDSCIVVDRDGKEIVTCSKNDLVYYNQSIVIIKNNVVEYIYPLSKEG